jgi:hypothetical protein
MSKSSHIVTLKRGTIAINGVQSIGGLGVKAEMADITSLADTARKRLPVLMDSGELDVEIDYDPDDATQAPFISAVQASPQTAVTYNVILSGTATETWAFSAYVSDFQAAPKKGEKLSATVKLSVDGAYTVTHA